MVWLWGCIVTPFRNQGGFGFLFLQSVSTGSSSRRRLMFICSGGRDIVRSLYIIIKIQI